MDALTRLISFYNNSSANDIYRQIAINVLRNIQALPNASSYEMAKICFSAPSTLRRLATKLGYKSYSAFKADLSWSLDNYRFLHAYRPLESNTKQDTVTDLLRFIARLADELEQNLDRELLSRVVTDIRSKKKIAFFVSAVTSQISRLELDLLLDGHEVALYTELHDQMTGMDLLDGQSLAILIKPEVPASGHVRELAKIAKAKGARTLVISNSSSYAANDSMDYVLNYSGSASLIDIYAIDMIVSAIVTKHQEMIFRSDNRPWPAD